MIPVIYSLLHLPLSLEWSRFRNAKRYLLTNQHHFLPNQASLATTKTTSLDQPHTLRLQARPGESQRSTANCHFCAHSDERTGDIDSCPSHEARKRLDTSGQGETSERRRQKPRADIMKREKCVASSGAVSKGVLRPRKHHSVTNDDHNFAVT